MTFKIDVRASFEYGVLVLCDPYAEEEFLDTTLQPVTATETRLAFAVPGYVDGEADVTLSDHEPPDAHTMVFSARIDAESGGVALADCNRFFWAFLPIDGSRAEIDLWRWADPCGRAWLHVRNSNA